MRRPLLVGGWACRFLDALIHPFRVPGVSSGLNTAAEVQPVGVDTQRARTQDTKGTLLQLKICQYEFQIHSFLFTVVRPQNIHSNFVVNFNQRPRLEISYKPGFEN